MKNEFTAVIERDGEWYIAYCPEIPGANGQGKSKECKIVARKACVVFQAMPSRKR